MPIHYECDDAAKRVVIKTSGEVTSEEVLETLDRQAAEHAWSFAVLYDAREGGNQPTRQEMLRLVQRVGELTAAHGPRGPVAFLVAPGHALLDTGRKYSRLGELTAMKVRVFTNLEEADQWLQLVHPS